MVSDRSRVGELQARAQARQAENGHDLAGPGTR
jgi:hypothetical protein